MGNPYFKFKKFIIKQDKCAMKVGTDGVLLGAWVKVNNVKRVLDVGTGTGLIAIMLGQRSTADIHAVEVEKLATQQAIENSLNCPWRKRIRIYHVSLQEFMKKNTLHYDLIVTNPPYYSDAYKHYDTGRKLARHNEFMSRDELLSGVAELLTAKGRFAVIYPTEAFDLLCSTALKYKLYMIRYTQVFPTPDKSPKRILAEFSFQPGVVENSKIIIENDGRHNYSQEYIKITKEFYLNF